MSYAWENFRGAIQTLAGTGSQKDRLASAYIHNLVRLEPKDLPKKIQEDFSKLSKDITRIEGADGSVIATVNEMDESHIKQMVEKIIDMHDTVTRHREPL